MNNSTGADGGVRAPQHCKDLNGKIVKERARYVPGPDSCTLCICDPVDGPIFCRAVLCSPPKDCKSVRAVNTCCEFICLDDTVTTGGPFGPPDAVDLADVIPKIVIASVCSMLSLALLLFLVYRLRQKHMQGRMNSAEACHAAQMCDECDDTRSLDFSNDCFFERPGIHPMSYPPNYLASWKPPSSYFPPRGEAPPPYEEAIATSSNCVVQPSMSPAISNNHTTSTNFTSSASPLHHGCGTIILTNENIQNPNQTTRESVVFLVQQESVEAGQGELNLVENNPNGPSCHSSECDNPQTSQVSYSSSSQVDSGEVGGTLAASSSQSQATEGTTTELSQSVGTDESSFERRRSSSQLRRPVLDRNPPDYSSVFRNDLLPYSSSDCQGCFRHSLTLPRHAEQALGQDIPESYAQQVQQRFSLQFNVAGWSSSSSTLSLSTPNTPEFSRPDSSLSSSSSST